MIGRYAFAVVIGTIVTLSLLFVMHLLIATGKAALTKPRERAQLDFVRVRRNEALNVEDYTPEKPPKPHEHTESRPMLSVGELSPSFEGDFVCLRGGSSEKGVVCAPAPEAQS